MRGGGKKPRIAQPSEGARRQAAGVVAGRRARGPVRRPRARRVDKGIIEALQRNGREPFRRIAATLGVSEATVRARYARLCEDDILQVTGVTNPLGLGFEAQAMVGVRTAGPPDAVADEIARWEEADYVVVRPASSTSSSSSSAPTAARCSTSRTGSGRSPEVVSTESFLYLEF